MLLMIQLWDGWNDDDDESDDEDFNVAQNNRDASTQTGGRHCSGVGKVMTAPSVGTATEEDVEAGHRSGGAFAVFEYLSKVQPSASCPLQSTLIKTTPEQLCPYGSVKCLTPSRKASSHRFPTAHLNCLLTWSLDWKLVGWRVSVQPVRRLLARS